MHTIEVYEVQGPIALILGSWIDRDGVGRNLLGNRCRAWIEGYVNVCSCQILSNCT